MTMGRTAVRCPAVVALYFVCMGLYPILGQNALNVTLSTKGDLGGVATLNCTAYSEKVEIQWIFKDELLKDEKNGSSRIKLTEEIGKQFKNDADGTELKTKISKLTISNVTSEDAGNYTCIAKLADETLGKDVKNLNLSFAAKLLNVTESPIRTNLTDHDNITMECVFEAYNVTQVKWYKEEANPEKNQIKSEINPKTGTVKKLDARRIKSVQTITIHTFDANGTYSCEIDDPVTSQTINGTIHVFVYAQPKIINVHALGISPTEIYVNWTLLSYNSKFEDINIYPYYIRLNDTGFIQSQTRIDSRNTSAVLTNLMKNTTYTVKLEVETKGFGKNPSDPRDVVNATTLISEPYFVPNISINGFSATSVTIGWAPPPSEIKQFIHYYLLEARKKDENVSRKAYHSRDDRNLPYMFGDLEPHSTYIFRVCACSGFGGTEKCGNWSDKMEAATLDGVPSKPENVTVKCTSNGMKVSWLKPAQPRAEIKGYTMELTGNATFQDHFGNSKHMTWGPLSKFTKNNSKTDGFDDLQPNTNYTLRISAMTRTRRRGEEEVRTCYMPPAPPDQPPRPRWRKIFEDNKYMFKMYLPRISERNGPICCYRVYMVRLPPQTAWRNLSQPAHVRVLPYAHVHAHASLLAAYITDIFSNANFPRESELVMGDSISHFNRSEPIFKTDACKRCLIPPEKEEIVTTTSTTTTMATTLDVTEDDLLDAEKEIVTGDPLDGVADPDIAKKEDSRKRRSYSDYGSYPIMADKPHEPEKITADQDQIEPIDGPLDPTARYTLFVELIPGEQYEAIYSNYVNVLQAAPTPAAPQPPSTLEIALQVTCAVAAVILLLMIVFCIRQSRRSRKVPPHAHVELNPLERAYRSLVKGLGGRPQTVPQAPPDMPPIAKEDLVEAYAQRQADSDYGFQKEFEFINMLQYNAERVPKSTKLLQMLPECFPDRTTHASEARENQSKNRYPDIKAYDQTRVRLSQIDSITGSDYINANYVRGYQERKQFICAQGPTDTTVNDFWRMIWEHGLELIVMLTNLEEYSKVKCSKYWPDEIRGSRAFGPITVHHVSERRYSDYIVRELRITKQPTNADGQPIVENNGVAKRNGDIKEAGDSSVPTSPRELKDTDSRIVKQYHFLMWKDFAAPEHAYSILKFIKRVNEAWSSTLSRPAVVHCSAGVGRTGTLVALDCLLQQLHHQHQVAIFNTVAELRAQRNYLVQSLKQYVFVYRSLAEYAVYGDTEIPAGRLKACVDRLRTTPSAGDASLMEIEFEKILNNPIPEVTKSCAAGAAEELRNKNRSPDVLPHDRNRVILAPVPARDYSTYINASFIEAYDNSEGFIITQDPLPNTIVDFWRMVSEHNVTTIVMLSELGEGKCPRYWEDGISQHEHISVHYEESESCPYYTRRQFRVVNNKSGESSSVRQLQYQGWPTAPGHVPEVTRGLAELADAANANDTGTMLVHCQLGTERSSLFVALCILISQLRAERRVDVCYVTRKVRAQRDRTIDTFLHYEFLHRAILNYAELHNLLEDS